MATLKRLYLLSESEISDLYARPSFNLKEQILYFELSQDEENIIDQWGALKTKIYFILQLGYFKAKNQFFIFDFDEVAVDVAYICDHLFKRKDFILQGKITRQNMNLQKQAILKLFGYQEWSHELSVVIQKHLESLIRYYPKGHDTFRQLLTYLESQKIVIPTYRTLQDLFTQAFSKENKRLIQLMLSIPLKQQEQLTALLNKEEGITDLNALRYDQKNFKYRAFSSEIKKALSLEELYTFSKHFLPTLQLSKMAIRYYAELTEQYAASRLRKLSQAQQWLQLLCFVHLRYQQIMDNLITTFIYRTRLITEEGKTYTEKIIAQRQAELNVDLPKLVDFLKWFPQRNPKLNHDELNQEAYNILPENQFPALADFLEGNIFDKKEIMRDFYLKSSRLVSLYLRPIILTVPFVFYKENNTLTEYISLLKKHHAHGKSPSTLVLLRNWLIFGNSLRVLFFKKV